MELTDLEYSICKYCGALIPNKSNDSVCDRCEREVYTDEKGREALKDLLFEIRDRGLTSRRG